MGAGSKTWLVPDGFLPVDSSGGLVSHEAICVLNTNDADASLIVSVYFSDSEPIVVRGLSVPAQRTRHIRTDLPEEFGGVSLPRGVPYALMVQSDIPVAVQYSRMDTTQPALTLMTTMAHPVG